MVRYIKPAKGSLFSANMENVNVLGANILIELELIKVKTSKIITDINAEMDGAGGIKEDRIAYTGRGLVIKAGKDTDIQRGDTVHYYAYVDVSNESQHSCVVHLRSEEDIKNIIRKYGEENARPLAVMHEDHIKLVISPPSSTSNNKEGYTATIA